MVIAESEAELKTKLLKSGRIMGAEVKRLQLSLSEKSKILPINAVTHSVARILNSEGITVSTAKVCDDV